MKFLKGMGVVAVIAALTIVYSCKKETIEENVTISRDITIGAPGGGMQQNKKIANAFTVVFNAEEDKVEKLTYSSELVQLFEENGIKENQIIDLLQQEAGASLFLPIDQIIKDQATAGKTDTPFSDCINNCLDKYKKGEGRGACKAACVVDLIERLLNKAVDIIDITSDSQGS